MEKSVMIDLNDARMTDLAEVLANKTCKKILGLIADREMNASELARELKIPLNTVGYNLDKLKNAGLIEPAKNWWSVKGKKIQAYRVANKRIVISPRRMFSGVIPAIIATAAVAFGIKMWMGSAHAVKNVVDTSEKMVASSQIAGNYYSGGTYEVLSNAPNSWAWFFLGGLCALLVIILWNLRRKL